jgi:hypothetical protein
MANAWLTAAHPEAVYALCFAPWTESVQIPVERLEKKNRRSPTWIGPE